MSALAVTCGCDPRSAAATLESMLRSMERRGHDWRTAHVTDDVAMAQSGFDWQKRHNRSAVARNEAAMIVADAAVYYRADLAHKLGLERARVEQMSDAEAILAAYLRFGTQCVAHLEGDFAFVIWDSRNHTIFAARDFSGQRNLYYSQIGDTLVLASTVAGVLAQGSVPITLNLDVIAEYASMLWSHTDQTAYQSVRELQAGHSITWTRGKAVQVERFWNPPEEISQHGGSLDTAAEELLALLSSAVIERMSPAGPTAVTLSGGWDSSSVYGAGQHALAHLNDSSRSLTAVSISYPEGDPGREDEFIQSITSAWNGKVAWIDSKELSVFADAQERLKAASDAPVLHGFESWNRALFRTSANNGARVTLGGWGGDQLFQVSLFYLSDLVRRGRVLEAFKQWRSRGGIGAAHFYKHALEPLFTPGPASVIPGMKSRRPENFNLDRVPPWWVSSSFQQAHRLQKRDGSTRPPLPVGSSVLAETHAYLLFPYFPRVAGQLYSFAIEEGVEARQPLLDARVVNFAVSRPWYERADGAQTKVLLRRAMRGIIPYRVLAPRTSRTGIASGAFVRDMQLHGHAIAETVGPRSILAQLKIVDPAALAQAWSKFMRTGNEYMAANLYFTIQTEMWLRARYGDRLPEVACSHS